MSVATAVAPLLRYADFLCAEPRGLVMRRVQEVAPSQELETYLASELKGVTTELGDLKRIWEPGVRTFLVDTVGVLIGGNTKMNHNLVDVHAVFWDRRMRGREGMCRWMAQQVARDAGCIGVWTAIFKSSPASIAFAKRVGFTDIGAPGPVSVLVMLFA